MPVSRGPVPSYRPNGTGNFLAQKRSSAPKIYFRGGKNFFPSLVWYMHRRGSTHYRVMIFTTRGNRVYLWFSIFVFFFLRTPALARSVCQRNFVGFGRVEKFFLGEMKKIVGLLYFSKSDEKTFRLAWKIFWPKTTEAAGRE